MSETRKTLSCLTPSGVDGKGHVITESKALIEAWHSRDRQYAQRATPLTEGEVVLIQQQRRKEARYVEPRMRGPLTFAASRWHAPKLGEWA